MSENIVIAVLGVIASLIGSASLINWRLKELERKVAEHNNYGKLFAETSKDIALIQQDMAWIKREMEQLEKR